MYDEKQREYLRIKNETNELEKEMLMTNSEIQKLKLELASLHKIVEEKEDIINDQKISIIKIDKEREAYNKAVA